MRRHNFSLILIAAALGWSEYAIAQNAAPAQDEAITVTGRKLPAKAVHRYVRQITSSVDGQLTRFNQPVCPTVIGFPEQYGGIIAKRIRRVASEAGVRLAKEKCRANLVLIIARDADMLVRQWRAKSPGIFEGVDSSALQVAYRSGPVHVWNTTELLNEDGQRASGGTMTVKSASILTLPTQHAIAGSMIVIDDDVTIGKSLTQIADYAAMRALAGATPPREGLEADTILTLFDSSVSAPLAVTAVDRSYLAGLYSGRANLSSTSAMQRISRRIRRDAEARGEVANN
ncbi:hypothetical protein [Sphingomonas sp.]|uniref:hypothetical protein n=1 Tax=Sphingomonas sp. TaxID=28214 RepID=UPI002ED94DED